MFIFAMRVRTSNANNKILRHECTVVVLVVTSRAGHKRNRIVAPTTTTSHMIVGVLVVLWFYARRLHCGMVQIKLCTIIMRQRACPVGSWQRLGVS